MIMFRFSTSVRTQDNITSHFCLIARRIGTPYHQMIISGSSIGRNNNIMMMYFCILQTGNIYNPQIQISVVSGTKRSIFRQKNKTKRSKKRLHTTLIKPEQKVNEDLCSGFIVS